MSTRRTELGELTEAIASDSPTPGGGSASAIALSQAAALAAMVSGLTIGRERWQDGWPAAEAVMGIAGPESRRWALEAADRDAEAFDMVMAAFRMPRDDDDALADRKQAIEEAIIVAAEVPLEVAERATALLATLAPLAEHGNANAVTDVAVSALLAHAASVGAGLNVAINAASLPEESGLPMLARVDALRAESDASLTAVMAAVDARMGA